jgi:outer membrane lipoprotein SlyB
LTGNTNNASLWTAIVRRCFGGDPIGDRRVTLLSIISPRHVMENTTRNTHPMIIVAAVAVTIASLAAVASLTGLLPGNSAPETELTAAIPPPPPLPPEAAPTAAQTIAPPPAAARKAEHFAPPPSRARQTQQAARDNPQPTGDLRRVNEQSTATYPPNDAGIDVITARPTSAPPPLCRNCGTIEAIHEVNTPADASGLGAVAGGVLGGLLGNQVGRGKGNTAATIVGAVGGAYAGHQTEKYVRADKQLQVTVRFEDGSTRTVTQEGGSRWQVGDHVRLSNGSLVAN